MLFMKKYFSAENVFIFQLFLRITLFFIIFVTSVFFLGGRGQTQHAYDFPKLSLILYL